MHQQGYIKVIHRGTTYGSIEAPTNLDMICRLVRVTPRANPILKPMGTNDTIISNMSDKIESGLYELLSNPNVEFDPTIDHIHNFLNEAKPTTYNLKLKDGFTQTTAIHKPLEHTSSSTLFPLKKLEMKECTYEMLRLIGSIPPRYTKFNKVLSLQIDTSIEKVQEWMDKLDKLYKETSDISSIKAMHSSGVSMETYITFIQYRILNMLHDVWKKVWIRFSPPARVFSISKLYQLHSLKTIEHILNCLASWRRMMERDSWIKIKKHVIDEEQQSKSFSLVKPTAKDRLLMPSRIVGEENAGDFIQLTQSRPELRSEVDTKFEIEKFRKDFVRKISEEEAYTNKDYSRILDTLLREKEISSEHEDIEIFPSKIIRHAMKQEFQIL